jgi:hypothetical protein
MKNFKIADQLISGIEKPEFKAEFTQTVKLSELPQLVAFNGISYLDGVLTVNDASDKTTAKVVNGVLNII